MANKRKIYLISLWLCSEDVSVEIKEFTIKRKGKDNIQTEEGQVLYSYKIDNPVSGVEIGTNSISVSMITEDFLNIDKAIQKMVNEGKKRVDLEMQYLKEMDEQLVSFNNYGSRVTFRGIGGLYHLENNESDIILKPFRIGSEPISINDYDSNKN